MGGLDLEPVRIGYIMGLYGCGTGLFQMLFFAKIVRAYGTRRVFIWSMMTFIPVFMMFPVISLYAKAFGVGMPVWILMTTMLTLLFFMDTAYGTRCPPLRCLNQITDRLQAASSCTLPNPLRTLARSERQMDSHKPPSRPRVPSDQPCPTRSLPSPSDTTSSADTGSMPSSVYSHRGRCSLLSNCRGSCGRRRSRSFKRQRIEQESYIQHGGQGLDWNYYA